MEERKRELENALNILYPQKKQEIKDIKSHYWGNLCNNMAIDDTNSIEDCSTEKFNPSDIFMDSYDIIHSPEYLASLKG